MALDSFELTGSYLKDLMEESARKEQEDVARLEQQDTTRLRSLVAEPEEAPQKENILKQPVSVASAKELTRGLLTAADEALIREGSKGGLEIFLDTMRLIPKAVKMIGEGIGTEAAKISLDPTEAAPALLSIAGGIAGGATGNPALAYAGGVAGRTLGQYLKSQYDGRDFGNWEDAISIGVQGIGGTNITAPIGGAVRGALRKRGLVSGPGVGIGLVKNTVERDPLLLAKANADFVGPVIPSQQLDVTKARVAGMIQEAAINSQALRDAMYGEAKRMKLLERHQGKTLRDVLTDTTVSTREKIAFLEESKSIEEDLKMAASLKARKGAMTKKYGAPTDPNDVRTALTPTEAIKPLTKVYEDRAELIDALLVKPRKPGVTPLETKPGQKRRFAEYAEQQEKARIGSAAWRKQLNEYANEDIDALKTILTVSPEYIDDPFIKKLSGRFASLPSWFNTQVGFRRNDNKLFQHIGDIVLHSSETIRTVSTSIKQTANAVLDKYNLSEPQILHLINLQNNGNMMMAYDTAKEQIEKMTRHEASSLQEQAQAVTGQATRTNITMSVSPKNFDDELKKELLAASQRYKYKLDETEMDDFLTAVRALDEVRTSVSDPLYGTAYALNPDPQWLKMMNPAYFLPTFTQARDVEDITFQLTQLKQLQANLDKSTTVGQLQHERYEQVIKAMTRKQTIAQKVADKEAVKLTNLYSTLAERGVTATHASFGGFQAKTGAAALPFDLDLRAAMNEYIDGFVRKAVYDNSLPKAHAALQEFVSANIKKRPYATERAGAWAHAALLDQLGLRKNARLQNMRKQLASPYWEKTVGSFEGMMNFIQKAHWVSNVALKPRFYGLQVLQNILTLAPQVDTESLAYGLYEVMFNRAAATERAKAAGVITEGVQAIDQTSFLKESTFRDTTRMSKPGVVSQMVDKIGTVAEASENLNRLLAYEAGLHHAQLNNLTGAAAHRKALDIVRDAHFMYDAANRPTITNTPFTSMMFRYRTFGQNYASYLANQIRSGDVSRIGASFAALWSVAGTSGIPLYSMVRLGLAKYGIEAPELKPSEEALGWDLGGAESPLPTIAVSPDEQAGVFWNEAQDIYKTLADDKSTVGVRAAALGLKLLGSPAVSAVSAAREFANQGIVTSPQGQEVKSVRSARDIILSGIGLQPSARALQSDTQRRLKLAISSNNPDFIRNEITRAQKKGVTNIKETLTRMATRERNKERTSVLDVVTGIPSLQ